MLRVGSVSYDSSGRYSQQYWGKVIQQRPQPGAMVLRGTPIDIWIAQPPSVVVPDLTGYTPAQAAELLGSRFAGALRVSGVTERPTSNRNQHGRIIGQRPSPRQRVQHGTSIALVVGRYSVSTDYPDLRVQPQYVQVPPLYGKSVTYANQVLARLGLRMRVANSPGRYDPNRYWVSKQNPDRGRSVTKGSVVTIWITPPIR